MLGSNGAIKKTGTKEKKIAESVIRFGAIHYKLRCRLLDPYHREKRHKPVPERLHSIVEMGVLACLVGPILQVFNTLGFDELAVAEHFVFNYTESS
jgi:hypothetical protein